MNQPKSSKEWQKSKNISPIKLPPFSNIEFDDLIPYAVVGTFLSIILILLIMYVIW